MVIFSRRFVTILEHFGAISRNLLPFSAIWSNIRRHFNRFAAILYNYEKFTDSHKSHQSFQRPYFPLQDP